MLKLKDIFNILLFVGTLLTGKIIYGQSVNDKNTFATHQHVVSSHVVKNNFSEALFCETNYTSEDSNFSDTNHFASKSNTYYYNVVAIQDSLANAFLTKISVPLYRLTHLFIFFHCWKFLFF